MRLFWKSKIIVFFTIIAITAVFYLPDAIGYLSSNQNRVYTGNSYNWDPWDINVYVSVIKFSQINGYAYRNLFTTTELGSQAVVYPLYSLLGVVFRSINAFAVYNFSTAVFTPLLLFAIYFFVKTLSKSDKSAMFTTIIASFAGGFGWLVHDFGIESADLNNTPFMTLNVFQRPHTALALSFHLLSLAFYYQFSKTNRAKFLVLSGVLALLTAYIYPYMLLAYFFIVIAFFLVLNFKKERKYSFLKLSLCLFVVAVVGTAYSVYILSTKNLDSVLEPALKPPNLISLLSGIGLFSIPFVYLLKNMRKNHSLTFVYVLLFSQIFLAYLPLGFARYYLIGIYIPLSFLTILFFKKLSSKRKKFVIPIFLSLSFLTAFFIQMDRVIKVANQSSVYYWSENDLQAVNFLATNSTKNTAATYPFANFIPALTANHVYFGHRYQTPNSQEKAYALYSFYNNQIGSDQALGFVQSNNIDYVVWRKENNLWQGFPQLDKPNYSFLNIVFENSDYTVWSIVPKTN